MLLVVVVYVNTRGDSLVGVCGSSTNKRAKKLANIRNWVNEPPPAALCQLTTFAALYLELGDNDGGGGGRKRPRNLLNFYSTSAKNSEERLLSTPHPTHGQGDK